MEKEEKIKLIQEALTNIEKDIAYREATKKETG
jgi:hypothetical protein